jgi:histidinol phosphatase-like PHP family hydrolase
MSCDDEHYLPYDAHVHTTFSDGRGELIDCVRAAEAAGLQAVAITDHWGYAQSGDADLGAHIAAIIRADAASEVTVIPGVEATILNPRGDVSIRTEEAALVRWVMADFSHMTEGVARNVPATMGGFLKAVEQAMVNAAANPVVDAIAHPFNLGRWEARLNPEDLPADMIARVAEAFAANGCVYELMDQAHWWHPDIAVAEYLRQITPVLRVFSEAGVYFCAGSDAHSSGAVGNLGFVRRMMREAGITRDQLVDIEALNAKRRHEQATRGAAP